MLIFIVKEKRIEKQKKKGGKVESMRKPDLRAPTAKAFRQAKKTAKKRK